MQFHPNIFRKIFRNLEQKHNQSIEEVLKNRGFLVQLLPKNTEWLPIHIFDDQKYELRTPEEWLAVYDCEGERLDFGGKTLIKREETGL